MNHSIEPFSPNTLTMSWNYWTFAGALVQITHSHGGSHIHIFQPPINMKDSSTLCYKDRFMCYISYRILGIISYSALRFISTYKLATTIDRPGQVT